MVLLFTSKIKKARKIIFACLTAPDNISDTHGAKLNTTLSVLFHHEDERVHVEKVIEICRVLVLKKLCHVRDTDVGTDKQYHTVAKW